MGSSKSSSLHDPIRGRRVVATPEERVRQQLIGHMVERLGYPKALISVERAVSAAGRRYDILCHRRVGSELQPLLAIECKAGGSLDVAWRQVESYNAELACPFIGVAVGEQVAVGWRTDAGWQRVEGLPSYRELLRSI